MKKSKSKEKSKPSKASSKVTNKSKAKTTSKSKAKTTSKPKAKVQLKKKTKLQTKRTKIAISGKKSFPFYSLMVSLIVCLAAFLFGYTTAIISGAMLFISGDMHLTTFEQELVVSAILVGAIFGAWMGGLLSDKYGRKFTLFVTSFLFIIGISFLYLAEGLDSLLVGRFVTGIGIGIASLTVPLYIAEMSPNRMRGMFVTFNQFAVTLGILVAYIVDFSLSEIGHWRLMFGVGMVPAILLLIGLLFVPETPSWLAAKGKLEKAKHILTKVRPNDSHDEVLEESKKASRKKLCSWRRIFDKSIRPALVIGIGLSFFQQITGINALIYYGPQIFKLAGLETAASSTFATLGIGVVNVLMTIVALWLIDLVGRRPLLITGISGMMVSLAVLSVSFFTSHLFNIGPIAVASLMLYIAFFAFSLGPITWILISEIYPMGVRGRAMGIAIFTNWISNFIVSLSFLSLIEFLGNGGTFALYTIISVFALWFVLVKIPETKGKSLEEIQRFWKKVASK
jgi:SP family galactose:H+ symporter-like MFS transporter